MHLYGHSVNKEIHILARVRFSIISLFYRTKPIPMLTCRNSVSPFLILVVDFDNFARDYLILTEIILMSTQIRVRQKVWHPNNPWLWLICLMISLLNYAFTFGLISNPKDVNPNKIFACKRFNFAT